MTECSTPNCGAKVRIICPLCEPCWKQMTEEERCAVLMALHSPLHAAVCITSLDEPEDSIHRVVDSHIFEIYWTTRAMARQAWKRRQRSAAKRRMRLGPNWKRA